MAKRTRCQHSKVCTGSRRCGGTIYNCGYGQVYAYDKEANCIGTYQDDQEARKAVWEAHRQNGGK